MELHKLLLLQKCAGATPSARPAMFVRSSASDHVYHVGGISRVLGSVWGSGHSGGGCLLLCGNPAKLRAHQVWPGLNCYSCSKIAAAHLTMCTRLHKVPRCVHKTPLLPRCFLDIRGAGPLPQDVHGFALQAASMHPSISPQHHACS